MFSSWEDQTFSVWMVWRSIDPGGLGEGAGVGDIQTLEYNTMKVPFPYIAKVILIFW